MKKYLLSTIFIIVDMLVLIGIYYLSAYFKSGVTFEDFYFVIFIVIALFYYEKIYTLQYDFWQETYKLLKALVLAYFIVLAILTLQEISLHYSRLFISLYFIFAMLLIPVIKRVTKRLAYSFSLFKKKVFVAGDGEQREIFKKEFEKNWYLGMQYSENQYDTVVISSKALQLDKMNKQIEKYLDKNASVYVVPYVTTVNFSNSNILEYSNIRYNTIQIENKLLIKRNIYIKNIFDVVAAVLISPLFLMLHVAIALAIKLDSKGKVFFKQERLGKNNNSFLCYKYRTMYENSADRLKEYLINHPEEITYYEKYHKYKNDPRITKVGGILRTTSLDELAQIINIFKGDMSLVGPRPYMLNESDELGKNKYFILKVKPGITGLWQVSGRNNLTFKERNELEVWYIKNWSLWADFVILVKTLKVVVLKIGVR